MTADRPEVAMAFREFISEPVFPCVGAKAALGQGHLEILVAGDMRDSDFDVAIVQAVQTFANRAHDETAFASFCVVFPDTPPLTEALFEHALWQRLQALHDLDTQRYAWDPAVSSDPRRPDFGLSLGGRGFYVIGLHPDASRPARRFDRAAMVFNLHSQFDRLRAEGLYDKLKEAISERDVALAGSVNPMLAAHGVKSEAPQYSGRIVGAEWSCPFHPRTTVVK
jgi:uncharacterized protein